MDEPIPDDLPPLKVREGLSLRRWPTTYLTPDVLLLLDLFRYAEAGIPPLSSGLLSWPSPLALAFEAIRFERAVADEARVTRAAEGGSNGRR